MSCDSLSVLLYQTGYRLISYGNQVANDTGLSFPQLFLLHEMLAWPEDAVGALSVSALSQKTGLSKSTVCNTVQALVQSGYLIKTVDQSDTRKKTIRLTGKARASRARITEQLRTMDRMLFCGLSRQERERFRQILTQIAGNMGRRPAGEL